MDCYLVDIYTLVYSICQKLFKGPELLIVTLNPTNGVTIFAYLRTGETSGIDY